MATYGPQSPTSQGLIPTYNPAGANDRVPPGVLLHITNANASSTVLTIITPGTFDGNLTLADRTVTIANATSQFVRVPNTDVYRDPADGLVGIQFSVTASVTYAVLT